MRKLWVLLALALGCWAEERQNVFIVIPDPSGSTSGHIEFLDAASGHKTTFRSANALAADLNYTWPPTDAHGCVVSDGAGNLSVDPTCSSGTSAAPFTDASPLIKNGTDATKLVQFDVSAVPTMTTYHLTVPGLSGTAATLALLERTQSFTAFSTFNVGLGIGTNGGQILAGPLTIKGETSTNGNILLQPGNVVNASVVIDNPRLDGPGLYVVDAAGTTTGNGLELRTNGGALYFKVIGGTDAGAPGTVVTKGVVPFTDNTYLSGNSGHSWSDVYSYNGDFAPAGIVGNYVNVRKLNINDSAGLTVFWDIQTHIVGGGNTSELVARDNAGTPTLSLIRQLSGTTFNNAVFDLNVVASAANTYSLGNSGTIWSALWTGTGNFASDATFQANLVAAVDNVSNMGNPSGNRFGIVAAHNADFAPAGATGNYANIRKLNVVDESGGTSFWDVQADASGSSNSQLFIRDNAGLPVLSLVRDLSSVHWNHAILDMNLIPTTSSSYTLGESGFRWANGYFTNLNVSGTCTGCGTDINIVDGPPFQILNNPSFTNGLTTPNDIKYMALDNGGNPHQVFKIGSANNIVIGDVSGLGSTLFFNGATSTPISFDNSNNIAGVNNLTLGGTGTFNGTTAFNQVATFNFGVNLNNTTVFGSGNSALFNGGLRMSSNLAFLPDNTYNLGNASSSPATIYSNNVSTKTLRVTNGTGSGGYDGAGATIYGLGNTGILYLTTLESFGQSEFLGGLLMSSDIQFNNNTHAIGSASLHPSIIYATSLQLLGGGCSGCSSFTPVGLYGQASSGTNLTGGFQGLSGASVFLTQTGLWQINGTFEMEESCSGVCSSALIAVISGYLGINGSPQTGLASAQYVNTIRTGDTLVATVSQTWQYFNTSTSNVAGLMCTGAVTTGLSLVCGNHSTLSAVLIHN